MKPLQKIKSEPKSWDVLKYERHENYEKRKGKYRKMTWSDQSRVRKYILCIQGRIEVQLVYSKRRVYVEIGKQILKKEQDRLYTCGYTDYWTSLSQIFSFSLKLVQSSSYRMSLLQLLPWSSYICSFSRCSL